MRVSKYLSALDLEITIFSRLYNKGFFGVSTCSKGNLKNFEDLSGLANTNPSSKIVLGFTSQSQSSFPSAKEPLSYYFPPLPILENQLEGIRKWAIGKMNAFFLAPPSITPL